MFFKAKTRLGRVNFDIGVKGRGTPTRTGINGFGDRNSTIELYP